MKKFILNDRNEVLNFMDNNDLSARCNQGQNPDYLQKQDFLSSSKDGQVYEFRKHEKGEKWTCRIEAM